MARIFVYGTLRRGMYNYDTYLKEEDSFRCYGYVRGTLYTVVTKNYPAFLNEGQNMVLGEIHEVCDETLKILDEMEGYFGAGHINNDYNKVMCDIYNDHHQIIDRLPVYVYNMNKQINAILLGIPIRCHDYVQYITKLNKESLDNIDVE